MRTSDSLEHRDVDDVLGELGTWGIIRVLGPSSYHENQAGEVAGPGDPEFLDGEFMIENDQLGCRGDPVPVLTRDELRRLGKQLIERANQAAPEPADA